MSVLSEAALAPSPQAMVRSAKPEPVCASDAEAQQFADTFWAAYRGSAHDGSIYLSLDHLFSLLHDRNGKPPPVKLIRLSWMEERVRQILAAPPGARAAASRGLSLGR
jgi:hypothetical protein